MNIELKKIQFGADQLHRETLNFACEIYADGKLIASAYNEGSGGMTSISAYPHNVENVRKIADVNQYLESVSTDKTFDGYLNDYVDNKIDEAFNARQRAKFEKKMQNDFKKVICYGIPNGDGYGILSWKNYKLEDLLKSEGGRKAVSKALADLKTRLAKDEVILNTNIPQELY